MEKYVYKGKNKEELLKVAYNELSLNEEDIIYKETEEKSGLFQGKKIVIEIVKIESIAELGKKILENLLNGLNIKANIEKKIREKSISYNLHSDSSAILIGKHGKNLETLKTYLNASINSQVGIYVNIMIDIDNYKEKQNYFLTRDVKKIAREVTLSKMEVKLDPMNSYERRIVHNALSKFDYIETKSEGEEPNRYVVIKYKEKQN